MRSSVRTTRPAIATARSVGTLLAASFEHRPGRFLLFGVIVEMLWALLGVVLVVTVGQGWWWVLVGL